MKFQVSSESLPMDARLDFMLPPQQIAATSKALHEVPWNKNYQVLIEIVHKITFY
jgi:hypothetical protein